MVAIGVIFIGANGEEAGQGRGRASFARRKFGSALVSLVGLAICLAAYGLIAGEFATRPSDKAKLIPDTERHTYASIPCVIRGQADRELIVDRSALANPDSLLEPTSFAEEGTIGQVRTEGRSGTPWKRDPTSEAAGGFEVPWHAHQSEPKPRWTPDGDRRW